MIAFALIAAGLAAPGPSLTQPRMAQTDTVDPCVGMRALEKPELPRHQRFAVWNACLDSAATPASEAWLSGLTGTERIALATELLDAGLARAAHRVLPAETPRKLGAWEIARARLDAAEDRWAETDRRLRAWKENPDRAEGSGEILFWQGWSALHQGRRAEADSLFMLASAYVDEPRAQTALEYRYASLIDSGAALLAYVRGLSQSPLRPTDRLGWLGKVPPSSPLHAQALWQTFLALERSHPAASPEAVGVLEELAREPATVPGRRAAALLAFAQEPKRPDSALAAYERLLLEYQQGVSAEFARSRIQNLRGRTQSP